MTKHIHAQPSLFRRAARDQQSVSYTPGPNPDLGRFVEEHGTPYDPSTDEYNVPPFDKPITSTKATAIYNMHTYWSKKPHGAIRQYIRHYTQPGDLVLDPFCGSGGTALAALMEGRKAIAIDLSPAATFITKNYCTPVDPAALQLAFKQLTAKVQSEMDWLYETRCDRCDGRATTVYTVYSYRYQCPRCLEKVALFDCVEAQGQTAKGKPKKIRACPYCYSIGQIEEISTRSNARFEPVPVLVGYECVEGCHFRGERRHNDLDPKKRRFFEQFDLAKLREIESRKIPYWYPEAELADFIPYRMLHKKDFRAEDITKLSQLFTKRNLWALALIRDAAMSMEVPVARDITLFAFTGVLLGMSRMNRYRPDVSYPTNILNGTYYIPPIGQEEPPLKHVLNKINRITKGMKIIRGEVGSVSLMIDTRSATNLAEIPSDSIDYIFTDPPYADKVQYAELNFVWEAWLGFDSSWRTNEIIVSEIRDKTDADWARMMSKALHECYRVLKAGRWLSLCYHDTSEGTWQLLQDMMTELGFIPESTDTALYIDTGQKSFNQLMAEKVTRRDLVINFRKPRPDELPQQLMLFGDEDAATFTEKARAILNNTLETHPGSPADRLYDELVSRMVRQRVFERHNFDELLRGVAEEVDGRWYLLETAGQVDAAESAKEEAAAARLETFMREYLAENPGEMGVHFSDLFEQNLFVQDKPRRDLKEWLPEYFFRTEAGTWRPPANDEEWQQKETLRAGGTLRRIKRFGNALLEGVPPAERDQPENLATAANWIRQCRRAGLYELGRALYEKGGFSFDELSDESFLEVEEDYQICVRRS